MDAINRFPIVDGDGHVLKIADLWIKYIDHDKTTTRNMIEHMGAEYFMWPSDYPHIGGALGTVSDMREIVAPLPEADQCKVPGESSMRFYNLSSLVIVRLPESGYQNL